MISTDVPQLIEIGGPKQASTIQYWRQRNVDHMSIHGLLPYGHLLALGFIVEFLGLIIIQSKPVLFVGIRRKVATTVGFEPMIHSTVNIKLGLPF